MAIAWKSRRDDIFVISQRSIQMANTYTQIYVQFVFAVKHRDGLIRDEWKDELYKYITGIVQNEKHKMLAINGMNDHVHVLAGIHPDQSLSDLMKHVKANSSKWINDRKFVKGKFEWQAGFGAFSYSRSQISNVIQYIQNQENHHRIVSFREEYLGLLKEFEVEFDERYVFGDLM